MRIRTPCPRLGETDSAAFETERPVFVKRSLRASTDPVSVVSEDIFWGTYNEFEFEVEDVDLDYES